MVENSLASPANVPVGEEACPAVPRTFVNKDSCVRRPQGTCAQPTFTAVTFKLDKTMLRFFYTASERHVHALTCKAAG